MSALVWRRALSKTYLKTLNKLMIQTQPATMMTMKGKQLSAEERDILRASMVSEGLK